MDSIFCSRTKSLFCCCSKKRGASNCQDEETISIIPYRGYANEQKIILSDISTNYGSTESSDELPNEKPMDCSILSITADVMSPVCFPTPTPYANDIPLTQNSSTTDGYDPIQDSTQPQAPLPSLSELIASVPQGKLESSVIMALAKTFVSILSQGSYTLPPLSLITSQALLQRSIQVAPLKPVIINYLRNQTTVPSALTTLLEPLLLRLMSIATDGKGHILFSFNFNDMPQTKDDDLTPFYSLTAPSKDKTFSVTLPSLPLWVLPVGAAETDIGAAIKSESGSNTLIIKDRVMVRIGAHGLQSVRAGDISLYKALLTLSVSVRCDHGQWEEETDLQGRKVLQSRICSTEYSISTGNRSIINTEPVVIVGEDGRPRYQARGSKWWLRLSAAGIGVRIALPDIDAE